jgi:hypothetical protein
MCSHTEQKVLYQIVDLMIPGVEILIQAESQTWRTVFMCRTLLQEEI